jgi:hypothetical protein
MDFGGGDSPPEPPASGPEILVELFEIWLPLVAGYGKQQMAFLRQ